MYVIDGEKCTSCGSCKEVCPVDAIVAGTPYVITDACIDCGSCEPTCPVNAISPGS